MLQFYKLEDMDWDWDFTDSTETDGHVFIPHFSKRKMSVLI